VARRQFPKQPQDPVACCCLLPATLIETSPPRAVFSALDVVVCLSSR
jgi:hypothetical protein